MLALVFIYLLHTCACKTNVPSKPRSVNLALETIVEFDKNDNSADVEIIDKVRNFLGRIRGVIHKNKPYRRNFVSGKLKFTDFAKEALTILSAYDDNDLEDVVSVVVDELKKYHYKGCKFHELLENRSVRRAMAENLEKVKNAPAVEVRDKVKKMLRTFENDNLGSIQKIVLDFVNSIYGDKSEGDFKEVLDNLAAYKSKSKRTNMNLIRIVRDGIRSVVFDHYSRLDEKTRRDLKLKLESFWNDITRSGKNDYHVVNFSPVGKQDISRENKYVESQSFGGLEVKESSKLSKPKKIHKDRHKKSTVRFTRGTEGITDESDGETAKKWTKPTKYVTHMRGQAHKSTKKFKRAREIIAEHEAVINVQKDTLTDVFSSALNQLFGNRNMRNRVRKPTNTKQESTTHPSNNIHQVGERAFSNRIGRSNKNHKKTKSKHMHSKRHRKPSKRFKSIPADDKDSYEGLSIKSFEVDKIAKNSLRKNNLNDTLLDETITDTTIKVSNQQADVNVLRRINELEKELKVVKEQMRVTEKYESYDDSKKYEELTFWEGTKGLTPNTTTPELPTKTSTIGTKFTTTITEPDTTVTTTKTTKLENITFIATFRSRGDSEKEIIKPPEKQLAVKLNPPNENVEIQKNLTDVVPLSRADPDNLPNFNNSAEMDYLNELREPDMNLTDIADIERYLNETKPIGGDDKTRELVRKEMLERLKGVFPNEGLMNSTVDLSTTMSPDITADPMKFLDVDDDINIK